MTLFPSCQTPNSIFKQDLKEHFTNASDNIPVMTTETIAHLPGPLQKYLTVCGFVDRDLPVNAQFIWTNSRIKMKPDGQWMKLKTYQYNSVEQPFRIALMKARIAGIIPFEGRDLYTNGYGNMMGKILKGITVMNVQDKETAQSAAIVLLAEALMVPGYIFQEYISWQELDEYTVKGTLSNNGITAEGIFQFNEKGQFIGFHTLDRNYDNGDGTYKKVPYSIKINDYQDSNGFSLPSQVSAVWHLKEGDYEYWNGTIEQIHFNITL